MLYEDRYKEFEQYLTSGEPGVEERARNWSIAIGLQDVDGLKPSEFLLEQAKANIEGRISSAEVGRRLEEYYSQKSVREKAEADVHCKPIMFPTASIFCWKKRRLFFLRWSCLVFMAFFSRAFSLMPGNSVHTTSLKINGFLMERQ